MFARQFIIPVFLAAFSAVGCASPCCVEVECSDPAVPLTYPLGAVSQAHYNVMQDNGEAADFVISELEFEPGGTALTYAGRDHILELSARMRETPFPVLIEPSGSDPNLDTLRREMVATILNDLGNSDAEQRTLISRPYSDGMAASEAIMLGK